MAKSAIGIIFSNMHEENIPELVRRRTMASIPFGGRYRLVDFTLSNMVNSGITTVGLVTSNNYRSLIDHIGSGKDWDLARKDGGLILLPPFSDQNNKLYTTKLEALSSLTGFLSNRKETYVVLADCDGVAKVDIDAMIAYHESKNADMTLLSYCGTVGSRKDFMLMEADADGRIVELKRNPRVDEGAKGNLFINYIVINREFLLNIVEDAVAHGFTSFQNDVLVKQVASLKLYQYAFGGYYGGIDSMAAYYKHNMELLDKDVRDDLFGDRDIYTKVRDSAPSKYGEEAVVKNSLISDGCVIEGVVENSILFRGVKVAKGAVVKNSIVMQDNYIGENTTLNCVITDKDVVINESKHLSGCSTLPYFIQKGTRI